MRWLLIFVLSFIVFNSLQSWLEKIGLGHVPGDFKLRVAGRDWHFPFGSTLFLSLIGLLLARWL